MNQKTQELTTGAMFTAIFAVLLLLNRQTGGMFEGFILYLLPIPMVGYSSRFGLRSGLPVLAAMGLISIFVSTPTAIFYALTEAAIGLVMGSSVHAKKDPTKTLLLVMVLSALVNVVDTILLVTIFGYDLGAEITEMKTMCLDLLGKSSADATAISAMQALFTDQFLLKMMVISLVLSGLIQGFIVFEVSLLILRRLKFQVPKPKSVYLYYPPMILGILSAAAFLGYSYGAGLKGKIPELYLSILQILGICGYLYLLILGALGFMLLWKAYLRKGQVLSFFIAMLLLLIFPMAVMILGIFYSAPEYHEALLQKAGIAQSA